MVDQCKTCRHYVGQIPGSTQVMACAVFPYGPTGDHCPDHEAGTRYGRPLEITFEEDPTTPPAAVVEAERLLASVRKRSRRGFWWRLSRSSRGRRG
jgi:hypothetical protein